MVEPDAIFARMTQILLGEDGAHFDTIKTVENLDAARRALVFHPYDAILFDLSLSDGSGPASLRELVLLAGEIPVLAIAGPEDEHLAAATIRAGAQDCLIKGHLNGEQIRHAVRTAVERKNLLKSGGTVLESVLNGVGNAILFLKRSGDGWRILLANPICEEVFGHPLRDLSGQSLEQVLDPVRREALWPIFARAMETGSVREAELCWSADDKAPWAWIRADVLRNADGLVVTLSDLTAIRQREEELKQARQSAQQALDKQVDILLTLGHKVPGALQRVHTHLRMAGSAVAEGGDDAMAEIGSAQAELASLSSELDALVELRQSVGFSFMGAEYLSILELSPDLSAVVRASDAALFFLNEAGRRILGIETDDPLDCSFTRFVAEDYRVLFEDGMGSLRGEGKRVPMHLTRKDGEAVDVDLVAVDCPPVSGTDWDEQDLVLLTAIDTTRRNRASRRIVAREEQLRKIMDNVADAIVVVDEDGRIETLNRAAQTVFGLAMRESVGTGVGRLFVPMADRTGHEMSGLDIFLNGGEPARIAGWRRHLGVRSPDGETFPIELAVRDLSLGERRLYIGLIRDISERVTYEENILFMATHDLLTRLANRTHFQEKLAAFLSQAKEGGRKLGILFFDVDHFKAINDSYGHLVGDRALVMFAGRLGKILGNRARLIARLSADEFVAVIDSPGSAAGLIAVAEEICAAIARPMPIDNLDVRMTCSVGISEFPTTATQVEDLIRGAEVAVRTAKSIGRSSVRFYDEALSAQVVYGQRLETALASALEGGQFHVLYQPKVNLETGELIGAEALARWTHPDLGDVPPSDFVPIAEETGQIREIGEWVLRRVCHDLSDWIREGVKPVKLAVNLSAVQFREGNLAERLHSVLEEFGVPPALLEIELTESVLVEDITRTVETLKRLKALGLTIAIDDFGTGYSSFGYLTRFPIDCLKIDRTFVRNIPNSADETAITRAIIGMAKTLKLSLVAEGVETELQAEFLRAHGCEMGQGYLFGRPLRLAAFRDRMVTRRGIS